MALADMFGIMPWDLGKLTVEQLYTACKQVDAIEAEQKRQSAQSRRRR